MIRIFQLSLLTALFLILNSCSFAPKKRPPQKATVTVEKLYKSAQVDIKKNRITRGRKKLKTLIEKYPHTDVTDDAYLLLGKSYYDSKNFEAAFNAYISIVNAQTISPEEAYALYRAAKSLSHLGRYDEALGLTERSMKEMKLNQASLVRIHELRYYLFTQLGDRLDALKSLIFLAKNETDKNQKDRYEIQVIDFIETQLSDEELEKVASDRDYGNYRAYAQFKAGTLNFESSDFGRANYYLEEVIDLMPNSDLAERAQNMINQIRARRIVNAKTIGVVLPLSGRHESVAYKTLRGLQLGLGIFGDNKSSFRLAVVDSEDNPDVARRAVEKLVTEDHVISVVGSLLSKTAVAVASKCNELGVPNITLSQKAGLTDIGDYVFRSALTSDMQVKALVRTAMQKYKMRKFAILYPNDAYGVEYANLFWDEVKNNGGQITAVQPYESGATSFSPAIQRLSGTFYTESRIDEYKSLLRDWFKEQKRLTSRTSPPSDILPPVTDFDAIFIPDSIKAVGQIAPTLAYHDIKKPRLIGTNLWNSPALAARAGQYVEGALFVDGYLKSDQSFTQTEFYKNYVKTFGERPSLFEAQAYDVGLLLRKLIEEEGESSRVGLARGLVNLRSLNASLGSIDMTPKRELNRPMFTLTIDKGKITVIK